MSLSRPGGIGILLAWLGFVLGGCSPDYVEGSLSVLLDMHYKTVYVEQSASDVALVFSEPRGTGEDTVLRVSAKLDGVTLFPNIAFNLAEKISDGTQRGAVSRNVLNEPEKTFPAIREGTLHLIDVPGKTGSKVGGDFNLIFDNCTDFACGYTAYAYFTGQVP
jgi:hypothetical protein